MNRNDYILGRIDKAQHGLEIGPSYSPVTPKSDGWSVETADHIDAQALRNKYMAQNIDVSQIEEVDHIIGDEGLALSIGGQARFDWIIASHVIERTPDMVRFLQDCETLLVEGGVLSLAIPDKRFCFDVFQPVSTTGSVLEAYWQQRTRHTMSAIFDTMSGQVTRGGALAWPSASSATFALVHDLNASFSQALQQRYGNGHIDTHAWRFVPASFTLVLHDLQALGLTRLGISAFANFNEFEFFVTLKKGHRNDGADRIQMYCDIAQECAVAIRQ